MQNAGSHSDSTRRQFLTVAGGLAIGAALPRPTWGQPEPSKKLGYALVGLGRLTMGQLLPAFAECTHSKPVALVSGHPDKAKDLAGKYGIAEKSIYNYENFDNIKDNPEIDIVFVVLPNSMHAEYTIRAAKAGKHVLCEKPMANTVEECRQMIDACSAAKRKLMIGYRLFHEPYNLHASEICRTKQFGEVRMITADHAFNIGPNQWRLDAKLAGGGPLMDLGIYCINGTRYLTGEHPTEVTATMVQPTDDPRFKEVEASIAFDLKLPSGAVSSCTTSYAHNGASRFSIFTEKASIDVDPAFAYNNVKMSIRSKATERPELPNVNQFAAEMDHMSRCVLEDKAPVTPGEMGMQDMQVIEAIYLAAKSGKKALVAK